MENENITVNEKENTTDAGKKSDPSKLLAVLFTAAALIVIAVFCVFGRADAGEATWTDTSGTAAQTEEYRETVIDSIEFFRD